MSDPASSLFAQIIVSHHLELLLPIAHSVVHLVNGSVTAQGTVAELRESGHLGAIVEEEKTAIRTEAGPEKEREEVEVKVAKVARQMKEKEGRGVGQVTVRRSCPLADGNVDRSELTSTCFNSIAQDVQDVHVCGNVDVRSCDRVPPHLDRQRCDR